MGNRVPRIFCAAKQLMQVILAGQTCMGGKPGTRGKNIRGLGGTLWVLPGRDGTGKETDFWDDGKGGVKCSRKGERGGKNGRQADSPDGGRKEA